MYLKHLDLENFRNYPQLSLDFSPHYNVLVGDNAQGKTNIIESIYLASCARSHRTAKDRELIYKGAEAYKIRLEFVADNASSGVLELAYEQASQVSQARRIITYNGFVLDKLAELFGIFHAVIFAPEDLMLIKNGPSERRRFLDILISQISPSYFRQLQIYQKVLQQRNQVLKQMREAKKLNFDRFKRDLSYMNLDIWDEQMASSAAFILKKRQDVTDKLKDLAQLAMEKLSSAKEVLDINYLNAGRLNLEQSEVSIKDDFIEKLKLKREDDISRGYSSLGPHRDDLLLKLNDLDAQSYASQGQQRSLVLALKVAELGLLEDQCEMKPVLLLDDVMSELDAQRRNELFQLIEDNQVFITCTDLEQLPLDNLQGVTNAYFTVKQGEIKRLEL